MPFDTATDYELGINIPVVVGNTLSAIGITPVSRKIAEDHKIKVVKAFRAENTQASHFVDIKSARWLTRRLSVDVDDNFVYEPDFQAIRRQLTPGCPWTSDKSGAPAEIVRVAEIVHQEIEQAKFSVEFFYTDPILNVTYTDTNGDVHHDCLGIWDQGKVVAIAQTSHSPVAPTVTSSSSSSPWYIRVFGL